MELNQIELKAIEKTVTDSAQETRELDELQLALVGGGIGDVIVG